MFVKKLLMYEITCPHCGSEIKLSAEEYKRYRDSVEGYAGSTILCQRETEDGKKHDITYTNLDCPVCKGYIPLTTADGIESDNWGFAYSNCVKPIYDFPRETSIEDYINDWFGANDSEEST